MSLDDQLAWATSGGGNLILLPVGCHTAWEGIDPPSGGRVVKADFRLSGDPTAPATDYDRACDINDFLGLVAVGDGEGLILGDQPMMTAWWPGERKDGGILIRWEYGEEETDIIHALSHIPEDIWQPEPFVFTIGEGPLFLFDSAYRGSDVDNGWTIDHVTIHLPAGQYALATAHYYRPDDKTSFVLHRLSRNS